MSHYKRVLLPTKITETRHPDSIIELNKLVKILTLTELELVGITSEYNPVLTSSLHSLNNGVYLSITGFTDKYEYLLTSENIPQVDDSNNYVKKNDRELPQEEITIHLSFHVTQYNEYGVPVFPSGLHVKSGDFRDFVGRRTDRRMKKILCVLINDPDSLTLEIINEYTFLEPTINFWDLQSMLINSISELMTKYYNYIIVKEETLLSGADLYNYRVKELSSVEYQIEMHNKKIQEIKNMEDYAINRLVYDKEIKNIRDTIGLLNMHINSSLGMKPEEFKKITEEKKSSLSKFQESHASHDKSLYRQKYIKYKHKYIKLKNKLHSQLRHEVI